MEQAKATKRPSFRGVKRTIALALLVTLILSSIGAYRHVVEPARIRRLAIDHLERLTGRKVEVASATFSLRDGILLRDVYVSNEPLDGGGGLPARSEEEVFSCHEISILQNTWSLLRGRLEIESFEAIRPTLTLEHDEAAGWAPIADLFKYLSAGREKAGAAPPIELRHARVKILHHSARGIREVEDFQLTVRGRRDSGDPRIFDLVWQDANDPDANGHTQIDLETGLVRNIRGGLPSMSLRGVLLAVDAGYEGANALAGTYGLEGRIRVRDFNLMTPPLNDGPRFATIDLHNAAIAIPVSEDEEAISPDERFLRFHKLSGSILATGSGVSGEFEADFRGSQFTLSGSMEGPLARGMSFQDLMVRADLRANHFQLPDANRSAAERRFIERWPELVRFIDRYDPHGLVDLDFHLEKKPGSNEKFTILGADFTARGADASWYKFPYRVSGLEGVVAYDHREGLFVRQLCGKHGVTGVCVNGWLESPRSTARAQFAIAGKNLFVDEDLVGAMEPVHRRWVEEFSLSGTTDVAVVIDREGTTPDALPLPWDTIINLAFGDLNAIVPAVPLPVTGLVGRATVWPDRVEIPQARGNVASGTVEINGNAALSSQGLENLSLSLEVFDAVLNGEALEKLPSRVRGAVEPFHARGCVSAETHLEFQAGSGWHHETVAQLRNFTLQHDKFPLPLDRAFADLRVTPETLTIERARGYYDSAELFAKGDIKLADGGELNLVLEAEKLRVDEGFRQALPPAVRDALSDWQVNDPIQSAFRLTRLGGELTWSGEARLDGATVVHRSVPRPLEQVDATVSFGRDNVRSANITCRYGPASLAGRFAFQKDGEADQTKVSLRADNVLLDESVRGLLPPGGKRVWDEIQPTGKAQILFDEVLVRKESRLAKPTWSVNGHGMFRDVAVAGGDAIMSSGVLEFSGMVCDRLGGINLAGHLGDAELQLYGQSVTNSRAEWMLARTADGRGRAAMDNFQGEVHGGTGSMQALLEFDEKIAQYRVATSLQNVELAAWLGAWRARNSSREDQGPGRRGDKPSDVRGLMGAQLHLGGVVGQPESRTGGGRAEVRDGYIYKLPIFLAILNVLNINIPNQDVLSEASGRFYITGSNVRIADIDITGDTLSLVGAGTLSLSDDSVDLRLVNAGAGRLEGIPVLAELWKGASRELVELRVTGPVSQPQVRAMPFGGVTEEFKSLFQKRKPRRSLQTANP